VGKCGLFHRPRVAETFRRIHCFPTVQLPVFGAACLGRFSFSPAIFFFTFHGFFFRIPHGRGQKGPFVLCFRFPRHRLVPLCFPAPGHVLQSPPNASPNGVLDWLRAPPATCPLKAPSLFFLMLSPASTVFKFQCLRRWAPQPIQMGIFLEEGPNPSGFLPPLSYFSPFFGARQARGAPERAGHWVEWDFHPTLGASLPRRSFQLSGFLSWRVSDFLPRFSQLQWFFRAPAAFSTQHALSQVPAHSVEGTFLSPRLSAPFSFFSPLSSDICETIRTAGFPGFRDCGPFFPFPTPLPSFLHSCPSTKTTTFSQRPFAPGMSFSRSCISFFFLFHPASLLFSFVPEWAGPIFFLRPIPPHPDKGGRAASFSPRRAPSRVLSFPHCIFLEDTFVQRDGLPSFTPGPCSWRRSFCLHGPLFHPFLFHPPRVPRDRPRDIMICGDRTDSVFPTVDFSRAVDVPLPPPSPFPFGFSSLCKQTVS